MTRRHVSQAIELTVPVRKQVRFLPSCTTEAVRHLMGRYIDTLAGSWPRHFRSLLKFAPVGLSPRGAAAYRSCGVHRFSLAEE